MFYFTCDRSLIEDLQLTVVCIQTRLIDYNSSIINDVFALRTRLPSVKLQLHACTSVAAVSVIECSHRNCVLDYNAHARSRL